MLQCSTPWASFLNSSLENWSGNYSHTYLWIRLTVDFLSRSKCKLCVAVYTVFSTTFLQSGRMLTDHAGSLYILPLNVTVLSDWPSILARNAAQTEPALYTVAWR
jgi:drug/metabolite transporter superfamily protein YnfA